MQQTTQFRKKLIIGVSNEIIHSLMWKEGKRERMGQDTVKDYFWILSYYSEINMWKSQCGFTVARSKFEPDISRVPLIQPAS